MVNESSNLNELNLVQVLEQASDARHIGSESQKLAEHQLKLWETEKGFHFLLQSIYLDLSISLNIRWLAIIQFKNGVEKYWRSTRVHAILKDEKASIRARLFDLIDENNSQLCIQNSQATARIARLDFPGDWPNLFEILEQLFENDSILRDNIKMYNLLLITNQVVKVMATARIGRCRPAMQSKTPLIFSSIVRTYIKAFNEWTSATSVDEDSLSQIQVSYLALKVLRRLTIEGYESPHRNEPTREFLQISIGHFETLLSHYDNYKSFDSFEKFVRCFGKLYFNLICTSPSNFILLPCSPQILIAFTKLLIDRAPDVYNENAEINGDFWEQIAIRGLLILKKLINFIHKKGAVTIRAKNDKAEVDAAIQRISVDFLNEQLVKKWVDLLMEWYIKLRLSELENWSLDPEEWMNEQLSTSYEYQIRPCAENFFQDLISTFPDLLVPYLLNKIQTEVRQLSNTMEDLLRKDAIFASFQLSATTISDSVDFDSLLVDVFLPEATSSHISPEHTKILKRRIALVINEWCTVKCSEESKQTCYKFFLQLLTSETDRVILLTSVQTLRTLVDDWNFKKHAFQPFLDDFVFVLLKRILPSVSLTETRLYVLNTLSDIIIQTKPLVTKTVLVEILQVIPELWELSIKEPGESILTNALLRLLRHLVDSLGKHSSATWQIALPITRVACDSTSAFYSLLYEDGFELWQSLLQNYSVEEQQLDTLFFDIIPFLDNAVQNQTEILPTLIEIVKSYTLILSAEQFMKLESFAHIIAYLSKYLLKLRDDSFDLFLTILDVITLVQNQNDVNSLTEFLSRSGTFTAIFDALFCEEPVSTFQAGQLLKVMARIAFLSPPTVLQILEEYQSLLPTIQQNAYASLEQRKTLYSDSPFNDLVARFLSTWIVSFKDFYEPKTKKIHILGLSSMLQTLVLPVLAEFPTIVAIWVELLEEINETAEGDCEKFHLKDADFGRELGDEYIPSCEQLRIGELSKTRDPAHNVSLKAHINQTLEVLQSGLGAQLGELLSSVDDALLESLKVYLSIPSQIHE
ncbi:LADA_0C08042g1_1 [Lachancea dasiensis]|uniref:LADA_0C08042g1_1 n=1 Tax=Lachancea dasiensis TaxID=1072105 RepID=A0A1G4J029_9SACH|nr:LADA_0C08042g1_1 [Lachancea dasiensis]